MKNDTLQKSIAASLPSISSLHGVGTEGDGTQSRVSRRCKSEKGIALVMVLVLSAITLTMMTALIYMITVGTQSSGLLKGYKTALEAGYASADIMAQVIALREKSTNNTTFNNNLDALKSNLSAFSMNPSVSSVMSGCTGSTKDGVSYTGLATKVMTGTNPGWTGCNSSLDLKPADESTYDMKFDMGTGPRYTVYAKIVNTVEGNTGDAGLNLKGSPVVNSGGAGEVQVMALSSVYTIEVDAESTVATSHERVKLEVLYQY